SDVLARADAGDLRFDLRCVSRTRQRLARRRSGDRGVPRPGPEDRGGRARAARPRGRGEHQHADRGREPAAQRARPRPLPRQRARQLPDRRHARRRGLPRPLPQPRRARAQPRRRALPCAHARDPQHPGASARRSRSAGAARGRQRALRRDGDVGDPHGAGDAQEVHGAPARGGALERMRGEPPMSKARRPARVTLALYLAAVATSCGTISVEDEKNLGHEAQRAVRQQATLMRDRAVVNYVRQFGAELVAAARPTPFDVHWYVIEDEELNAFAIPGGSIYVHTGLLQKVGHADELAGVLAHELGHVTARHVAQNVRRQRNTGLIATIFTFAVAILTGNPYLANAGDLVSQLSGIAYL